MGTNSTTSQNIYHNIVDAIVFDYLRYFTTEDYKTHFDDKKGNKCRNAAEYLAEHWFNYDFSSTEKQAELIELMNMLDSPELDEIIKHELCELYKDAKQQLAYSNMGAQMYGDVAKAAKTLLKLDHHMSKKEIKSLVSKG